ncbi:hypothetical protein TURU_062991 [Turdus rufiventris]|nr:hypothetical protein TURU_062991 [Turdus rufiventris]
MALSRAAARGGIWRLGPAALSPPRERIQLQLLLGVSRSQVCSQLRRSQVRSLSSRATSRALVAAVAAAARRVSTKYEQFLERSFPRFYLLYNTFKTGIQALFLEAKEIRKIKSKMSQQRLSTQQLPYREMERLRQPLKPRCWPTAWSCCPSTTASPQSDTRGPAGALVDQGVAAACPSPQPGANLVIPSLVLPKSQLS